MLPARGSVSEFLLTNLKMLKLTFFLLRLFELLKNSIDEVEQFTKDYIDCEEKEYCRMLDEFNGN